MKKYRLIAIEYDNLAYPNVGDIVKPISNMYDGKLIKVKSKSRYGHVYKGGLSFEVPEEAILIIDKSMLKKRRYKNK